MTKTSFLKEPLALHLVWRRGDARAAELAKDLFAWLCFDPSRPTAHGIGLPTFLYECDAPPELPDDAARNVAVLFVDAAMAVSEAWQAWAEGLPSAFADSERRRLLVVAFDM